MRENHPAKIGPEVRYGANQQPACAAAHDRQSVWSGESLGDKVLGDGDEIEEGVLLIQHTALVVPDLAHFAASAHMGERVDHAAIDETEAIGIEPHRNDCAVGSVAVEQGGG